MISIDKRKKHKEHVDAAQRQRKLINFGASLATANLDQKVMKAELKCASWPKDFWRWFLSSAHFRARNGTKELSVNVENFVIDIHYHLHRNAKRKKRLRELIDFNYSEVRKVINHISTRWPSLRKCLERTLMQRDSLELYFLSNLDLDGDSTEHEQDETPDREKRLINAFIHWNQVHERRFH